MRGAAQGWGRLDLSGSLPLPAAAAGSSQQQLQQLQLRWLQVADWGEVAQGEVIELGGLVATGTG